MDITTMTGSGFLSGFKVFVKRQYRGRLVPVVGLFALLLAVHAGANADMVEIDAGSGLIIEAEYASGDQDRPLILFVHGFLQTRDFSTVSRLAEALSDNNYSTLSPNLSLGISRRQSSVPCESIHLHALSDAVREIGLWVDWAHRQGHAEVVILGHSAGSVMVSAYLGSDPQPAVAKTILISLDYFGPGRPAAFEKEAHAVLARDMRSSGKTDLADFGLSFCERYVTSAERFLSYYDWNDRQVLTAIKASWVENHVIFGGRDKRISKRWIEDLRAEHALVHVIQGASHFFDQTHEFDLLDQVESILQDD